MRFGFDTRCEVCAQGPMNGVTVYRTGEKGPGKNPHWRCEPHMPKDKDVPQDVYVIASVIENDGELS